MAITRDVNEWYEHHGPISTVTVKNFEDLARGCPRVEALAPDLVAGIKIVTRSWMRPNWLLLTGADGSHALLEIEAP